MTTGHFLNANENEEAASEHKQDICTLMCGQDVCVCACCTCAILDLVLVQAQGLGDGPCGSSAEVLVPLLTLPRRTAGLC